MWVIFLINMHFIRLLPCCLCLPQSWWSLLFHRYIEPLEVAEALFLDSRVRRVQSTWLTFPRKFFHAEMKIACMMLQAGNSSSELTRGDLHLLQSVQVGGTTGGTYLMPTLFSQPMMMVPQYPWTRGEMVSALNKLRVEILMVWARKDECVALVERGHLI